MIALYQPRSVRIAPQLAYVEAIGGENPARENAPAPAGSDVANGISQGRVLDQNVVPTANLKTDAFAG